MRIVMTLALLVLMGAAAVLGWVTLGAPNPEAQPTTEDERPKKKGIVAVKQPEQAEPVKKPDRAEKPSTPEPESPFT